MKIITVEEHFMVKEINDRFNQVIKPKDEFDKNQSGFVSMFVDGGQITDLDEQRICVWRFIRNTTDRLYAFPEKPLTEVCLMKRQ